MSSIAIIPARGGSKRIPRKNIKEFLGKPIIAYSIETAVGSGLFDEVMVSTDDDEIAKLAQSFGAKVPFKRGEKNADDFATTFDVLKEVLDNYKSIEHNFDFACCIYPTAPLVQVKHLAEGYKLLKSQNFYSVFPVVAFSYPVWRGLEINGNKISPVWPEYKQSRSQDLKKVYHDAGQWYWFRPDKIEDSLFTDNSSAIVLEETEVQDIDTMSDWSLAELKYRMLINK
jgi:pseudaminic acid cytidylyltransferase